MSRASYDMSMKCAYQCMVEQSEDHNSETSSHSSQSTAQAGSDMISLPENSDSFTTHFFQKLANAGVRCAAVRFSYGVKVSLDDQKKLVHLKDHIKASCVKVHKA